jgi:hypothetical protein
VTVPEPGVWVVGIGRAVENTVCSDDRVLFAENFQTMDIVVG